MTDQISTKQLSGLLGRRRLTVKGVVQGVGFRPFIFGLARKYNLSGFVGNDSSGVFIEIEGPGEALDGFCREMVGNPPPLAHIEAVAVSEMPSQGSASFEIVHSEAVAAASTLISPDLSICPDCLRELFDPNDRRYRYPFTNCTNCGPRFTIIKDIPYDRPLTTMAVFPMCPTCQAEYEDPLNRRFHAQPNACPVCGPQVTFQWKEAGEPVSEPDPLVAAKAALSQGHILAVKGLGGFHLACDATSDKALQTLREHKGRQDKPFALMVKNVEAARKLAEVNEQEEALLTCRERPVVLLKKKAGGGLSDLVAPGNDYVGIMLPYTPLHYLLVDDIPLVMTSGNFSAEPIVKDNAEALEKLVGLADAFLLHNRDIHVQCDDSVIRVFEQHELPIRRSRGYAPFPVKLPFEIPPTLAVGGELKSTFCLTKDNYAFMSQHIGDMENLETLEVFSRAYEHFRGLFRVEPQLVVADLHPRYLSAEWAQRYSKEKGLPLVQVQHHHAHIAGVMAENGLDGHTPVIGFALDGTGYGLDGAIWGGEVLLADYRGFRRVAHLKYIPLPGGDAAVKRPYRVALAHLWANGMDWDEDLPPVQACPDPERKILRQQLEKNINCVPTSSMGRLFDAIAALAGIRQTVTYEAQAAIEFEALSAEDEKDGYRFDVLEEGDLIVFAPGTVLWGIITDQAAGVPVDLIAARFHVAVANLVLEVSLRLREKEGLNTVALSGGVYQNVRLLKITVDKLRTAGFEVLFHRKVPPNDGGLALGQAIIGSQS